MDDHISTARAAIRLAAVADLAVILASLAGVAAVLAAAGLIWPYTGLSLAMFVCSLGASALALILRPLGGQVAYLHGVPVPRRLANAARAAFALQTSGWLAITWLAAAASSLR